MKLIVNTFYEKSELEILEIFLHIIMVIACRFVGNSEFFLIVASGKKTVENDSEKLHFRSAFLLQHVIFRYLLFKLYFFTVF